MKTIATLSIFAFLIAGVGCVSSSDSSLVQPAATNIPLDFHARSTAQPIELDGRLDEPVWQSAPRYPFQLSQDKTGRNELLVDPGTVQLAHDEDYLYLGLHLEDSDVVAEGEKDQELHFKLGDVAEVFLKHQQASYYWEFYATPKSHKSVLFFPGRGRLGLPSNLTTTGHEIDVAAQVDGSLNDWQDRDRGWTAEIRIRKADVSDQGLPLAPGESWGIFFARFNYSRYLSERELSMAPALSVTSFHRFEEYGRLILDPPNAPR